MRSTVEGATGCTSSTRADPHDQSRPRRPEPHHRVPPRWRMARGGARRLVLGGAGRDRGAGRRIRLRQERQRLVDHAAHTAGREPDRRSRAAERSGRPSAPRGRDAQGAGRRRRHGVPGTHDEPEPGPDDRLPDRRGIEAAPRSLSRRGRGRDPAAARPGPDPGRALAHRRLPAPLLGRHAPARRDRDGARLPAEAPDRGRAHDGARRDDPGPDPRPDQGLAGPGGHVGPLHHPRHGCRGRDRRPDGGDARRPRRRDRRNGVDLRRRAAPLYARAPLGRAEARRHGWASRARPAFPS